MAEIAFEIAFDSPPRKSKPAIQARLESYSPARVSKTQAQLAQDLEDALATAQTNRDTLLGARVEKNRVYHEKLARASAEVTAAREARAATVAAASAQKEAEAETRRSARMAAEVSRLASRSLQVEVAKAEVESRLEEEAAAKRAASQEAVALADERRKAMLALKAARAGLEYEKCKTAAKAVEESRLETSKAVREASEQAQQEAEIRRTQALAERKELAGLEVEHAKEVAAKQKTLFELHSARVMATSNSQLMAAQVNRDAAQKERIARLQNHTLAHVQAVQDRKAAMQ